MLQPDKERARASPHGAGTAYRAVYEAGDGLLADHVITGRSILPGASMVDLALAAAQARQLPCLALKDVLICRPDRAHERLEVHAISRTPSGSPLPLVTHLSLISPSEASR